MSKKNIILAAINQKNSHYPENFWRPVCESIQGDFKDYNIIKEWGDGFGKTKPSPDNIVCVVMHGNREVPVMKPRFEFLDGVCDNVWCVMGSPLRGWTFCDRNGYSGASSIARDHSLLKIKDVSDEDALIMHEYLLNKFAQQNTSKYKQPAFTNFKHGPFILVLGQVAGDSVINFSNFLAPKNMSRGTMREPPEKKDIPTGYLNTILTALSIMDKFDIPIIYKPHPCENQDQNSTINNLINLPMFNNVSIVSDVSIHELLPLCKAAVTINSGAGFEALIHLKPVITLGKADYSASTYECKDVEDIKNSKQFINAPVDELQIKKFLYAYLDRAYKGPDELLKKIMPQ
jgi:hypothetical protein